VGWYERSPKGLIHLKNGRDEAQKAWLIYAGLKAYPTYCLEQCQNWKS